MVKKREARGSHAVFGLVAMHYFSRYEIAYPGMPSSAGLPKDLILASQEHSILNFYSGCKVIVCKRIRATTVLISASLKCSILCDFVQADTHLIKLLQITTTPQ